MSVNKPWTVLEVRRLFALKAAGKTDDEAAAILGRTRGSVNGQLHRSGARMPQWDRSEFLPRVRELHGLGYDTAEIARQIGVPTSTVRVWMIAEGLKSHGQQGNPCRERRRALYHRQVKNACGRNLRRQTAEVFWPARCAARGWPQARNPREADILDLLSDGRPRTVPEVARELGMAVCLTPTGAQWSGIVSRHLRRLMAAGAIVRSKRPTCAAKEYGPAPGVCKGQTKARAMPVPNRERRQEREPRRMRA